MEGLVQKALDFGFTSAGLLDTSTLALLPEVRDMCAADKCRAYGRSWMCPPACGTLEENAEKLKPYRTGLIVQTTMELEDDFDYETMQAAGERQKQLFREFTKRLKGQYPGLLPLGSGGCTLCDACTYPGAPCRHPDEAVPSMEAFGLWVSDVCAKNGIAYNYGPRTITYTGCYLLA